MITIDNQMTAQVPSPFGMPVCDHAHDAKRGATTASVSGFVGTDVRERTWTLAGFDLSTKGDMGVALAYFPGAPAWRPPDC